MPCAPTASPLAKSQHQCVACMVGRRSSQTPEGALENGLQPRYCEPCDPKEWFAVPALIGMEVNKST